MPKTRNNVWRATDGKPLKCESLKGAPDCFRKGKYPRTPKPERYPVVHKMADKREHRQALSEHALSPYYHRRSIADTSEFQYSNGVRVTPAPITGSWRTSLARRSGIVFNADAHAKAIAKRNALK